jgi:hypothetical protein
MMATLLVALLNQKIVLSAKSSEQMLAKLSLWAYLLCTRIGHVLVVKHVWSMVFLVRTFQKMITSLLLTPVGLKVYCQSSHMLDCSYPHLQVEQWLVGAALSRQPQVESIAYVGAHPASTAALLRTSVSTLEPLTS